MRMVDRKQEVTEKCLVLTIEELVKYLNAEGTVLYITLPGTFDDYEISVEVCDKPLFHINHCSENSSEKTVAIVLDKDQQDTVEEWQLDFLQVV